MRYWMITTFALTLAAVPAMALSQDVSASGAGAMQAGAGGSPMLGTAPQTYAAMAADSDMYEIQSSRLALSKSRNAGVKTLAREMIADHMTTTKTLMAALPRTKPRIPAPPKTLSAENAAMIAQLRQASASDFDALYLQQQLQAHRKAWSLHQGFATDGADPALRSVAASAVPIIERHLQHLQSMPAGGMSRM